MITDSFKEKLAVLTGKTVRIYIEGGAPQGFAGFVLSVNKEYMVLLSVGDERKFHYNPRTVTIVPIDKITAISYFAQKNNYLTERYPTRNIGSTGLQDNPSTLNMVLLAAAVLILISLNRN